MRNGLLGCLLLLLGVQRAAGDPPAPPDPQGARLAPLPAGEGAESADELPGPEEHESHEGEHPKGEAGPERFWARGEYLLWWIRNSNLPPLIASGAATDPLPGALGMQGTKLLFGGDNLDNKERSGGRFAAGWWFGEERGFGVEASYLFLGSRSVGLTAASSGAPGSQVLARPFFNLLANREDSSLVAFPGLSKGSVAAYSFSNLQGAEASAVYKLCAERSYRVDLLAGFRWLQLNESVDVTENDQIAAGAPRFPGAVIGVSDHFGTSNNFYGGQVGFRAEVRSERLSAELVGKVALGSTHEEVAAAGATSIAFPGQPATVTGGGLLALGSNSGRFSRDQFAVVPEVGINVGFRFTEWLRGSVGYTFLYWSEVARPGNQIDRGLNVAQVPTSQQFGTAGGPARPLVPLAGTDFWAQGLSFGLEFRY